MWAFRRASTQLKYRGLSSGTTRIICLKSEVERCYSETHNAGVIESQKRLLDTILFPAISCNTSSNSLNLLVKVRAFCSEAGAKSQDQDDELEDAFSELESPHDLSETEGIFDERQNELDVAGTETSAAGKKTSSNRIPTSKMTKAILAAPTLPAGKVLVKWVEEGNEVTKTDISATELNLRNRRMFFKALQLSEWLESSKLFVFAEPDYASRVDLIAKVHGVYKAEEYIHQIPEAFQGEIFNRTLLANYVSSTNIKKAEEVFDKLNKSFPVTSFSCNQMLLLYKKTDKKKIYNILTLMQREKIKMNPFTYHVLIDVKGHAGDISGMDQVVAIMESEGVKPTTKIQLTRARYYAYNKMKEKSEEILRDVEKDDLVKRRWFCRLLLPVYAILGNEEEVNRIWKVWEPNLQLEEGLAAIEAFGHLKRIEDAELVFDKISKKLKKPSAKHFVALIKIYADHKMLTKGTELAKKMSESGCLIGPWTWHALVKLYVEAGEIEKADSVIEKALKQKKGKPLPSTYLTILDGYAKRGDIHNAEKIFLRMKQSRYTSTVSPYRSLLYAYINAKVPVYGLSERLKCDNVTPNKVLNQLMARVDALKNSPVAELLK